MARHGKSMRMRKVSSAYLTSIKQGLSTKCEGPSQIIYSDETMANEQGCFFLVQKEIFSSLEPNLIHNIEITKRIAGVMEELELDSCK